MLVVVSIEMQETGNRVSTMTGPGWRRRKDEALGPFLRVFTAAVSSPSGETFKTAAEKIGLSSMCTFVPCARDFRGLGVARMSLPPLCC